MNDILGLAGTILIVIGWAFELKQIMRNNHSQLDLNFGIMYLAGSIFLMAYALSINAPIFAFLNFLAAVMALAALYYKWHENKARKSNQFEQKEMKSLFNFESRPKTRANKKRRAK